MNKFFQRGLVAVGALVVAGAASAAAAAPDTTPISDAQAAALLIAAAIFTAMVTIWGAKIGYRKFFGS